MRAMGKSSSALARGAVRRSTGREAGMVEVGEINAETDWGLALKNVKWVVHTAARVHVAPSASPESLASFRRTNVQGTLRLARQAAMGGVSRFVFLSTVKVHGEATAQGSPFHEDSQTTPHDAYAMSKVEAEHSLREIASETGMEVVIIRPPLVYGPGVKANFAALMGLVAKGIPLPFGALDNRRSMVALDNLVDMIITCLTHPAAADQSFLVSDGHDLSTTELVQRIARSMNRPTQLISVPAGILMACAAALGRKPAAERLCGNLQVDITKARERLGWSPPVSVDEGLRRAVSGLLR